MSVVPDFGNSRRFQQPYRHAWIPHLFPPYANDSVLEWMERELPWKLTTTSFYQQLEFSLADVSLPGKLGFLTSGSTMSECCRWLRDNLGAPEIEPASIVAHLLVKDHDIGLHNDFLPNGETYRLILQLGRDVTGGKTVLFRTRSLSSVFRVINPLHGTAFAFEISECSYHAVSRVRGGHRFSIVYSFRPSA